MLCMQEEAREQGHPCEVLSTQSRQAAHAHVLGTLVITHQLQVLITWPVPCSVSCRRPVFDRGFAGQARVGEAGEGKEVELMRVLLLVACQVVVRVAPPGVQERRRAEGRARA
jgi:hypothetical protein